MNTAFFLVRRHANVYLDISSIPPEHSLQYFPRLAEISHKTLFGSDSPGPGVRDLKQSARSLRALPLSAETKQRILSQVALTVWPDRGQRNLSVGIGDRSGKLLAVSLRASVDYFPRSNSENSRCCLPPLCGWRAFQSVRALQ